MVRKGSKLTEEHKRKLSIAQKGKVLSDETKRRMSIAKSGKNHPQYGKHFKKNHRLNLSKTKNNTGFYKVSKVVSTSTKKGYIYGYVYFDEEGNQKQISSVDLVKLKENVERAYLPWRVVNREKALKTMDEEELNNTEFLLEDIGGEDGSI